MPRRRRRKRDTNQLELFPLYDVKSMDHEILRLEEEIMEAIRRGDLRRAEDLNREQQLLLRGMLNREVVSGRE
jgi:hypothetical protein